MSLRKRVTRIARGYLDQITDRLEEIERDLDRLGKARADAQSELQEAIDPAKPRSRPMPPSKTSSPTAPNTTAAPTTQSDWGIPESYKVLGLPEGTEFALVRRTYNDLMKKCDPARFPPDSEEFQKATLIREKIHHAYKILLKHFDPSADRFGELG